MHYFLLFNELIKNKQRQRIQIVYSRYLLILISFQFQMIVELFNVHLICVIEFAWRYTRVLNQIQIN